MVKQVTEEAFAELTDYERRHSTGFLGSMLVGIWTLINMLAVVPGFLSGEIALAASLIVISARGE